MPGGGPKAKMKISGVIAQILTGASLGLLGMMAARAQAPVDLLWLNGTTYTGEPASLRVEAVAVRDGRIVFAGARADAEKFRAGARRVLDLAGRTVLPGLTDAHLHLAGVGFRELSFNLEGTTGIADLQARLRARVAEAGPKKWIEGRGWIETAWRPAVFPTAADLDAAAPDNPVVLTRADGHGLVANSVALKLAGVDRTTPSPSGGEILHEAKSGEPTGMLIDQAMQLVRRLVPAATDAETERALITGAQRELALGWCQVHSAGNSMAEARLMQRLVATGKIQLRIYDAVSGPGPAAEELLQRGVVIDATDGRFTLRGIKLYMDGALGSRGAALLAPYADYASSGLVMQTEAGLLPLLVAALRQGVQVATHAIGDRGNRLTLDVYEKALALVPPAERRVREPRWRIEHAQVLAAADVPRFARLGVIASMQASHAIGDLFFAPSRLGRERLAGAYAWRSLLDTGAVLAGGSDAPVERGEPMIEFYAAVARRSLDGFANEDWHREQRLSREEALRMLTLAPAYAAFVEQEAGSIAVGKRADFTVLSADIMQIAEPEILQTRCVMTIVGGQIVFEAR
ncbi:MAG: amidohydrolase [Opitutus sp.]|nr:amidohydrolase [Opitutus sp.]